MNPNDYLEKIKDKGPTERLVDLAKQAINESIPEVHTSFIYPFRGDTETCENYEKRIEERRDLAANVFSSCLSKAEEMQQTLEELINIPKEVYSFRKEFKKKARKILLPWYKRKRWNDEIEIDYIADMIIKKKIKNFDQLQKQFKSKYPDNFGDHSALSYMYKELAVQKKIKEDGSLLEKMNYYFLNKK